MRTLNGYHFHFSAHTHYYVTDITVAIAVITIVIITINYIIKIIVQLYTWHNNFAQLLRHPCWKSHTSITPLSSKQQSLTGSYQRISEKEIVELSSWKCWPHPGKIFNMKVMNRYSTPGRINVSFITTLTGREIHCST